MANYENRRIAFDAILKKYLDYVKLYKVFNDGSIEGISNFEDFYWRYTYINRYSDRRSVDLPRY